MRQIQFVAVLLLFTGRLQAQDIEFLTPTIVHVTRTADNRGYNSQSMVVIAKPEKVKVSVSQKDGVTTYQSSQLTVEVKEGKVQFLQDGKSLLSEGCRTAK